MGLKVFENPEFGAVRAVEMEGEPWFVGRDVAEALGYSNTKDALSTHVDCEDKRILQRSEITTIENNKDGCFVRRWPSIKDASESLGLKPSTVVCVCKGKRRYKSTGGWVFRYHERKGGDVK